tara:strand:- start:717 stop:1079 length:363 start_codon:yes stop_codon:yes gene_type:complete
MSRPRRNTVRRLYREAILEFQGSGDTSLDMNLINAVNKDVHIAGSAPGGWVNQEGVLEIYCESGIENASDILDTEYGSIHYADTWHKIDKWVNLGLKGMGYSERVFHEPHNSAVIAVHWV